MGLLILGVTSNCFKIGIEIRINSFILSGAENKSKIQYDLAHVPGILESQAFFLFLIYPLWQLGSSNAAIRQL